jgi:protein arginine kinase activator
MEQPPDRPLECGECKKPIAVIYTEIVGKMMYRVAMCSDCPVLRQKLYGAKSYEPTSPLALAAGLSCGSCMTTADEVKMGAKLGCTNCYEVFEDLLTQELASQERLPQSLRTKRAMPLHMGKQPGQPAEVNPALKLLALHQALNETLAREDYEQAAWLRDQIKSLTEGDQQDEQKSSK